MFEKLGNNLSEFADHHQAMFAVIVGFSVICLSWGIEKILEHYLFPRKKPYGYIAAIIIGLSVLWLTQHYILHAV